MLESHGDVGLSGTGEPLTSRTSEAEKKIGSMGEHAIKQLSPAQQEGEVEKTTHVALDHILQEVGTVEDEGKKHYIEAETEKTSLEKNIAQVGKELVRPEEQSVSSPLGQLMPSYPSSAIQPRRILSQEERKTAVENGLIPCGGVRIPMINQQPSSMKDRMEQLGIHGVRIAVINNNKLDLVRGYGELERPHALSQAGSVSKLVTSLTLLSIIEKNPLWFPQGLNTDVGEILKKDKELGEDLWRQINPHGYKITIGQLLSHTAGIVSGGLYCYHVGAIEEEITKVEQEIHGLEQKIHPSIRAEESERVDAALQSKREKLELLCGAREIARKQSIPSINDILLGKTKLSPICKSPPGEKYDYSNSGYIILQKVIEIVTGNFSQAVRERVLSKLQMDESTFSPELAQTVHGNEEGSPLIGSWRINPMQAAGGLWSTAEDLSKMIVAIQKTLAKEGSPIEGLGYNLAQEMMKGSEQDKTYGFGVEIWRTKGGDLYFGHGGGVPGFRTLLIGNTKGDGAVISINSDREGEDIMPEILCSIATAYEWPDGTSLERCLLPGLIPEESSQLDPNTWEAWVNGVDGVGGRYVFRTEGQKPVEHNVVIKFDPKEKKVRAVVDG